MATRCRRNCVSSRLKPKMRYDIRIEYVCVGKLTITTKIKRGP